MRFFKQIPVTSTRTAYKPFLSQRGIYYLCREARKMSRFHDIKRLFEIMALSELLTRRRRRAVNSPAGGPLAVALHPFINGALDISVDGFAGGYCGRLDYFIMFLLNIKRDSFDIILYILYVIISLCLTVCHVIDNLPETIILITIRLIMDIV